ncbi:MAG: sugar phosphate isomerase/epimerase [Eubacterium sp.]|nr:sugar phosphate isomerase/epimerase [Eubacterium sp.]
MNRVLCSTGALIGRPNNRDYRLIKEFAPKLECDGFEFMMYSTWYNQVEKLINELINTNLDFPVMHCEKQIGEDLGRNEDGNYSIAKEKFKINCDIAKEIGAKKMVMHLWNGQYSDSTIENNIKGYEQINKIAKDYGIELLIENVVCNHNSPLEHWITLLEKYPDIKFIFDTKMAAFHSQLEEIYKKENKHLWDSHIRHLHINDYAGGYKDWGNLRTLPISKGNINFDKFFAFINQIQYHGEYTVEATAFSDNGNIDYDMLNNCFKYIKNKIKK